MQVKSEELRLLAQVGLLAAERRDLPAALTIFNAIEALRPLTPMPYIGRAIAYLQVGQTLEAVRALERGLEVVPAQDQPEVQAFLGMACHLAGLGPQSRQALRLAGEIPLAVALRANLVLAPSTPMRGL